MNQQLRKLKFHLWYLWYDVKDWVYIKLCPKLPKILTSFPSPKVRFCPECGQSVNIMAINTGDGWEFFWDCPNYCQALDYADMSIEGWFPFVFGWATTKDLEQIGIVVV